MTLQAGELRKLLSTHNIAEARIRRAGIHAKDNRRRIGFSGQVSIAVHRESNCTSKLLRLGDEMIGGTGQQQSLGIQPQNRLRRQRDRRGSPPIFRLGQEVLRSETWQFLLDEAGVVGPPHNKEPVFSVEKPSQPPAGQRQQ